jgi:hypothetical protein
MPHGKVIRAGSVGLGKQPLIRPIALGQDRKNKKSERFPKRLALRFQIVHGREN